MNSALRNRVRNRAAHRCEYCHLHQKDTTLPHEADHVRATKHRGPTSFENLALACAYCNAAKGPNVAGYDQETNELLPLFNRRTQTWASHFRWAGAILEGRTAIGRATIDVLRINAIERIEHRKLLSGG